MIGDVLMYREIPGTDPGSPSTRGARALAPAERATSTRCLDGIRVVLARIFNKATGGDGHVVGGLMDGGATVRPEMPDEDRLIRDFLADPRNVLRHSYYALEYAKKFLDTSYTGTIRLDDKNPGGPDYYLYRQTKNAAVRFYETHQRYKGARELKVVAAEEEGTVPMQFLPWRETKLTYCKLEPDTRLVLTGPINGCSIYVVTVTGRAEDNGTYLFHVNANESGLSGRDAAVRQKAKLDAAVAYLWGDGGTATITQGVSAVEYGATSDDVVAEGFVYGTNSSAGWEFFYYVIEIYLDGTCRKTDTVPAVLPRL
jgi:hypothetical protein